MKGAAKLTNDKRSNLLDSLADPNTSPLARYIIEEHMKLTDYETVSEAADRLHALPRLVQRWCKEGKLPCIKFGRDWLVERGAEPSVVRRKGEMK